MKPINIRLIDDDLVVYAVNVMMFSFEDVCKFTESDWLKVLDRYENSRISDSGYNFNIINHPR